VTQWLLFVDDVELAALNELLLVLVLKVVDVRCINEREDLRLDLRGVCQRKVPLGRMLDLLDPERLVHLALVV
jgi:hypothetical protein